MVIAHWRYVRQEDGEPARRFKIRKLRSCALVRFGNAAYTLVREDVMSSSCHFSMERPMGSKRTSRRALLKGGGALAGGFTLGAVAPALGQTPASGQAPAHDPSMATGSHDYPM